jgi:6,7-dimethyl-8-ribityllumazine synthase
LREIEGQPDGRRRRVAVVVSLFNGEVTSKLAEGALAALRRAGVPPRNVTVVRVPGSFELPFAAQALARTRRFDAIVALGAVIRGETDHYDYVCRAAQEGLLRVGLDEGLPVVFGVLTCETEAQAASRAGGPQGDKGADVALDALRMADLRDRIGRPKRARP